MNKETSLSKSPPTVLSCIGSDVWKEEVAKVIPKEIALDALLRVARSTASDNKFANCDPKSFLLALLKCGRAGLYPDGREAHLIAFGKDVQAVFDVKGICSLAGRAGILVTPKLVFENDEFTVEEDDGNGKTKILHRVNYRAPRGAIQAVYSRAVMKDGQVDYEIMSADEVEQVRQHYSRAKDSSPWKNSWGEMAKKTVIKRHSKRWDMSPEIRQALNSDDDTAPPIGASRLATPIFKAKAIELPPEPEVVVNWHFELCKKTHELCKRDEIESKTLAEFMQSVGLLEEGELNVSLASEEGLKTVLDNWEDFSRRMTFSK